MVVRPSHSNKVIHAENVDGVNSDLDKITDEIMTPKQTTDGDFENEIKRRQLSGSKSKS